MFQSIQKSFLILLSVFALGSSVAWSASKVSVNIDGTNYACTTGGSASPCWQTCNKAGYGFYTCAEKCGGGPDCWETCNKAGYGFYTCNEKCGSGAAPTQQEFELKSFTANSLVK